MINNPVSQSYEGPADPTERFLRILDRYHSEDVEGLPNDLRAAFQLGREQGHLEYMQAEYEPPHPNDL